MTLRLSMNLRTLPLLLLACLGIFSAEPAIADRIPQAIDNTSVWRLRGSVPPIARRIRGRSGRFGISWSGPHTRQYVRSFGWNVSTVSGFSLTGL